MANLTLVESRDLTAKQTVGAELLSRFIKYLDTSPMTVETYRKAIKQLFNYFSFNNIISPKREDIILFKEKLKTSSYKPSTIQIYITVAKLFFKWTAQEGLYPNISEHLKGVKLDRGFRKDYLTSGQVKEVLDCIKKDSSEGVRDYAILTLMIAGGLRTIEIIRANIEDLRTIADSSVIYVQGKGQTEKTDYIKITAHMEKAIRAYLFLRGNVNDKEPLFTSISNNSKGQRLSTRTIRQIAKKRLKAAGYNSQRLTAHSFRHTAITLSLLAGKDITEVQQFARHANITTTMIYNHALDKAKNSCSEAIAAAIF
jgi:integrase/recombinase XerC